MWGKALVIWYLSDIFGGDPDLIIAECQRLGASKIVIKFGNGLNPWDGLEPLIEKAHANEIEVWGYWFFYGQNEEGSVCGRHAVQLGIKGVFIDWESQADNSSLTASGLRNKANRIAGDLRGRVDTMPIALCSWWKPSYHRTPIQTLLSYCDYNAPQVYPIGDFSIDAGARRLDESLDEYNRLAGWPAEKTIPGFAAFGQTYGSSGSWWETTVPQMRASSDRTKDFELPGIWYWSWNYVLGKSGNPNRDPKPEFIEEFRRQDWGIAPPPPPVEKAVVEVEVTQGEAEIIVKGT